MAIQFVQCITSGDFDGDTIWDIRGGCPTDKSHRSALLKALPSFFVDPSEPTQTDQPDIIDEPIDSSPMTERPSLELSAVAEPAETNSIDLQSEFSVHSEPPFDGSPTKPLVIERKPPESTFSLLSRPTPTTPSSSSCGLSSSPSPLSASRPSSRRGPSRPTSPSSPSHEPCRPTMPLSRCPRLSPQTMT